jgi:hypothetical protein
MSSRDLSNVPQSVHDRLLSQARQSDRPFNELLLYYGIERFLYRLAQTEHAGRFVLKGALLLRAEGAGPTRPTRDIDVLDLNVLDLEARKETVEEAVRDAIAAGVPDDGMTYDPTTIDLQEIRPGGKYQGLRVTFLGHLGTARVPMQIDVGTGDVIEPGPEQVEYPGLLDYDRPVLLGYPLEQVIAEKFEAIVDLGTANTRMKDFYDIWGLSRRREFEGPLLQTAIESAFKRRGTPLPSERPIALTEAFLEAGPKRQQWTSFAEKARLSGAAPLPEVLSELGRFLLPPARAASEGDRFTATWPKGGPWELKQ